MSNKMTHVKGSIVTVRSTQTPRERGVIKNVEYNANYGPQYFVETYSKEWGVEMFWMRDEEIETR